MNVNVESASSPHIDVQESIAQELLKEHSETIAYLTTIRSTTWLENDWAQANINRIQKSVSAGASSVKIWKNFGMQLLDADSSYVQIDHPRIEPVLSYMEENQIPWLTHIAEPKNCWLPFDEMTTNNDRNHLQIVRNFTCTSIRKCLLMKRSLLHGIGYQAVIKI